MVEKVREDAAGARRVCQSRDAPRREQRQVRDLHLPFAGQPRNPDAREVLRALGHRESRSKPAQREADHETASVWSEGRVENRTAMPDALKSGLESLSGVDLSAVRVHYNSAKPAKLQAHAYTQGHDIEIGPGQERHLPHEGWHAVQQMQGRVKTTSEERGVAINDDVSLEREADVMGSKALQVRRLSTQLPAVLSRSSVAQSKAIQREGINSADVTIEATGANVAKAPSSFGANRFADAGNSIHQVKVEDFPGDAGTFVDGNDSGARVDKQGEFDGGGQTYSNIQVQANRTNGGADYTDLVYPPGTNAAQKGTSLAEVHIDNRIVGSGKADVRNRGARLVKQGLMSSRGNRDTYPRPSFRVRL